MSFEELASAALKMPHTSRAALVERLRRSLDKPDRAEVSQTRAPVVATQEAFRKQPRSPAGSEAMKSLFAEWDVEDKTDDLQELAARQKDLEAFHRALNANRPSERPLIP